MQASDRLRALVAEANRAPFNPFPNADRTVRIQQAHWTLFALAPQLAVLVADMADAFVTPEHLGLLARLDALLPDEQS